MNIVSWEVVDKYCQFNDLEEGDEGLINEYSIKDSIKNIEDEISSIKHQLNNISTSIHS